MSTELERDGVKKRSFRRWLTWGILIGGVALAVVAVFPGEASQAGRSGWGRHGWRRSHHREHSIADLRQALDTNAYWLRELDLSEDQRVRLSTALAEKEGVLTQLEGQRDQLFQQLAQALRDPDADPAQLERLKVSARELSTQAVDEGLSIALGVSRILRPEQRDELIDHWLEN
ncbi:MAG TPA: hypothetical protein PK413_11875 [Thermoanaerobaculia bacterium]|nr:hypothetical protein [Thermoanaerobaculia bacterium]